MLKMKDLVKLTVLTFLCLFSFAKAGLPSCESEEKLASQVVTLDEATFYGTTFVDHVDVELWTRRCDADYQLIATIFPRTPGKSTTLGYTIEAVQGDIQESLHAISTDSNLYVSKSYEMASNDWVDSAGIDYSKTFEVILACNNLGADMCSAIPTKKVILVEKANAPQEKALSSISGVWYDPAYNGSGFNLVQSEAGLFAYFYGYKGGEADGQSQWLLSEIGPTKIIKGQEYRLNVYSGYIGNGASFSQRPVDGSGIVDWGTMELSFSSCDNGVITLIGKDGALTHNVVRLAQPQNSICEE